MWWGVAAGLLYWGVFRAADLVFVVQLIGVLAEAVVPPCWAGSFWQSPQKEPKGLAPDIRPRLRRGSLTPSSLQGHDRMRPTDEGPSLAHRVSRGIHAAQPLPQ